MTSQVKNTFIDVEEEPGARDSRRSKTAPAKKVMFDCCAQSDDGSDIENLDDLGDDDEEEEPQPDIGNFKTFDPFESDGNFRSYPSTTPVQRADQRLKTYDAFEQADQFGRTPSQGGSPVNAPQPVIGGGVPVQIPAGQMQQGGMVMMMPSNMAPVQGTFVPVMQGMQGVGPMITAAPVAMPIGGMMVSSAGGMAPGGMMVSNVAMPTMIPTMPPGGNTAGAMVPNALVGSAESAATTTGSPGNSPSGPRPQTILKELDPTGLLQVKWIVDARKLKANDKAVISPPFEIPEKHPGTFRIILNPTALKVRGGATFKNSSGKGNVQLKCEADSESSIRFQIGIGDGLNGGRREPNRGPVEHNLAHGGVCGLPKGQEEWDFNKVVDESSKTFAIILGIY